MFVGNKSWCLVVREGRSKIEAMGKQLFFSLLTASVVTLSQTHKVGLRKCQFSTPVVRKD